MNHNKNLSAKTELAKKRIAAALAEYAANWENMQGSMEKKDLNVFLIVWKEDFDKEAQTPGEKLFQLANLLSNLDIQLDMLRSGKGWKKPEENAAPEKEWPQELAAVKAVVDAFDAAR
ncbi:hypothetical protein [Oxalobacter paraformigenes]|uniref:Uncharacterized protein n=1 Tax=Oxalobacter paraformigenes TaxID=556268 RepID=C3X1A3_9BURK|nr:hypothetical protein [Oxalobacter paraformigenes]EEO26989.1 hypothetical protein OFAG_00142 [Oxalobacter paraformigenes]